MSEKSSKASGGEARDLFGELHGLQGELSGGREDQSPGSRLRLRGLQLLEHGHEERRRLPAARPRHGHHILSIQDHWDSL